MKNIIKFPFIAIGKILKRVKYLLEIKYKVHSIYILLISIHWIYGIAYITGSQFYYDYVKTSEAQAQTSIQSQPIITQAQPGTQEWIKQQWEEAGVNWNEVWAVVQAESGWNSDAWNCNSNGSLDLGIYQGNSVHKDLSPSCALSTICSTKWAINLYKEQGWCPWVASKKLGLCK